MGGAYKTFAKNLQNPCVCMCVNVHTYIITYIHKYIHKNTYIYIYIHIYIYAYEHTYTYTCACVCPHKYTSANNICKDINISVCIYIYTYVSQRIQSLLGIQNKNPCYKPCKNPTGSSTAGPPGCAAAAPAEPARSSRRPCPGPRRRAAEPPGSSGRRDPGSRGAISMVEFLPGFGVCDLVFWGERYEGIRVCMVTRWCGVWWLPPSRLWCGSGGVDSVLGSLGGVESVVIPKWGLLVVVKLL